MANGTAQPPDSPEAMLVESLTQLEDERRALMDEISGETLQLLCAVQQDLLELPDPDTGAPARRRLEAALREIRLLGVESAPLRAEPIDAQLQRRFGTRGDDRPWTLSVSSSVPPERSALTVLLASIVLRQARHSPAVLGVEIGARLADGALRIDFRSTCPPAIDPRDRAQALIRDRTFVHLRERIAVAAGRMRIAPLRRGVGVALSVPVTA